MIIGEDVVEVVVVLLVVIVGVVVDSEVISRVVNIIVVGVVARKIKSSFELKSLIDSVVLVSGKVLTSVLVVVIIFSASFDVSLKFISFSLKKTSGSVE